MAAPTKTVGTNLFTLATVATATVAFGPTIDVSTKFAGTAYVHFGRTVVTALTNACQFRIDASSAASGDSTWYPLYAWQSNTVVAIATAATAAASGQKVITVTNTGYVVRDQIFIKNGTLASSEWGRITLLTSTTSVTIEDNLIGAQTTSNICNKAEFYAIPLDFSGVGRIRLVVDAAAPTGVTIAAEGFLTTLDTIA